jgi:hypothetical protein
MGFMPGGFLGQQAAPTSGTAPFEGAPVLETPQAPEEPSPLELDVQLEQQAEKQETKENFLEQAPQVVVGGSASTIPPDQTGTVTGVQAPVKDEVVIEVEKILEDGLATYFGTMPDDAKARFKGKGDEIAIVIADMVRKYKVKVKRVVRLVHDWLLTIPGVNKFFLEQEAKTKTDRILDLEETYHKPPSST